MKKRSLSFCLAVGMFITLISPAVTQAATLDEIKAQQQSKESDIVQLDNQINNKLTEINEKNSELETINEEVTALEETIKETAADIKAQEEVVNERLDHAKERLKTIQTNEVNQNTILSLIEAESVTDFLNRAYVLVTLQTAGNNQIESAQAEADELAALEAQQGEDKVALEEKSESAQEQKEALDTELASLQETMDENKALLDKLDEEKANEENRLAVEKEAAEKAAKEKAAQEAATQTAVKSDSASEATQVATKPAAKQPVPSEPKQAAQPKAEESSAPKTETTSSSSKSIVVSATGYSTQQAGLSTHTAMGIDLTKNPNVIAVDPSVIPLGSMVEVPGFGTFIAGDTGGAIKGNKIDIHFSSVQQALSWGRRTITVKVLD